jgi:hypothetical protein
MSNANKNILITPNRGLSSQPEIAFTGAGNSSISLKIPDSSTSTLNFESSGTNLLSVDSDLSSGSLFSVGNQSNQPVLEADADGSVRLTAQESVKIGGNGLALKKYPTSSLPSPKEGMLVYDTTVKIPKIYDGTKWVDLATPDLSVPPTATLVTNSLVDGVFTTGMTNTTNGDVNGSYVYQGTIDLGGCGGNNSAVFIRLKDTIPWNYLTCFFEMTGTSSCWGFNGGSNGYTEVTPSNPNIIPGGNLEFYDPYKGDRIFGGNGTFAGNPNYTLKLSACDNSPDNFFRFNTYKSFYVTSRRKSQQELAGPFASRSCNTTGFYIRISQIYIY